MGKHSRWEINRTLNTIRFDNVEVFCTYRRGKVAKPLSCDDIIIRILNNPRSAVEPDGCTLPVSTHATHIHNVVVIRDDCCPEISSSIVTRRARNGV